MLEETVEFRIADNFRNVDHCIHDLEAGLWRGAYGSKARWKWLLDSIGELFNLLNKSETLAQSLADTGLKAKVLALTRLAGTSIEVNENLPLLMALSNKDFAKAEQTVINEVNKCRAVCQRDFVKVAAELEVFGQIAPEPSTSINTAAAVTPPAVPELSIRVIGNTIVVEGLENPVEPHLAKWVERLIKARDEGEKVTGEALNRLAGRNKNVSREFGKLKRNIPALADLIESRDGKGGGWYLSR